MDFKIEKYQGNYNEFLNNARNLAVKLQSDRDKEKFKSEIMSQKERIALALVSSFQKEFNNPSKNKEEKINFAINKFLSDLSV